MCSVSNKLRIGLSSANIVFIYILGRQTNLVRLVPQRLIKDRKNDIHIAFMLKKYFQIIIDVDAKITPWPAYFQISVICETLLKILYYRIYEI
jgi:hypothetical protein